jgi:hypothetical protein
MKTIRNIIEAIIPIIISNSINNNCRSRFSLLKTYLFRFIKWQLKLIGEMKQNLFLRLIIILKCLML